MNTEIIETALINLKVGLRKYENLISKLHNVNVATDRDFQRQYNDFFKMNRRTPEFYSCYFSLLETSKNKEISFEQILNHIYSKTNRIEASFSSKMLSIIKPIYPVWDKYVLQNLELKAPYTYSKNRIEKTINLYSEINKWYESFIQTNEAIEMIEKFDLRYPNSNITNIKKIDLIIWQIR